MLDSIRCDKCGGKAVIETRLEQFGTYPAQDVYCCETCRQLTWRIVKLARRV